MKTVELCEAEINLSKLVDCAAEGEEFIIAKVGRPLARLVPLAVQPYTRELGFLRGRVHIGGAFNDPLPQEIQNAFDGNSP